MDIPGQIATLLTDHPDLGPVERNALTLGRTTRRGRGYTLTLTAVHQALLNAATTVITAESAAATRKAYRTYNQRVTDLTPTPTEEQPAFESKSTRRVSKITTESTSKRYP